MQPGQTITPKNDKQSTGEPLVNADQQENTVSAVKPEEAQGWQYVQDDAPDTTPKKDVPSQTAVKWTASEYIAHAKGTSWYVLLGFGLAVLLIAVYLLTRDVFAAAMVGVAGAAFGVVAGRQPRVLEYSIDTSGIRIGDRQYGFSEFRSFTLQDDGPLPSLLLLSVKRFMPPITLFYDPKQQDVIINALGSHLPHEVRPADPVDKLMSRIRF